MLMPQALRTSMWLRAERLQHGDLHGGIRVDLVAEARRPRRSPSDIHSLQRLGAWQMRGNCLP